MIPAELTAVHAVAVLPCKGFSRNKSGFSLPQNQQFLLFTCAFKWKCASSENQMTSAIWSCAKCSLLSMSLSLKCCITDIVYGVSFNSNLNILWTLVLLAWLAMLPRTFLNEICGVSPITCLTSAMFVAFLIDFGRPEFLCLLSVTEPVSSKRFTARYSWYFLMFSAGYFFFNFLNTVSRRLGRIIELYDLSRH